ncbi:pyridoxamine 5'-phosphate oxidase family protein [Paracoccus aminophilus]|uniref:Flavin-nucleotide-binding protein n=1 Tax=Paracoccus aminophilus JCM 7686 TaxID=1367847 RepID=S5YXB2_PARAH|nr:pyridoxamine 5'-phosphate oxidase family protein [Paracoccus aminophilus]AGT09866.1 hypothetical protein JCM7686_2810 [Paracoccus aminophilus JCM 7686]
MTETYPVTPRNRVKREPDRGSYSRDEIYRVLDAAMLCHVAYVLDGQPFCTPTLLWREGDVLYWHGSSASRMIRQLAQGAPACVTVSHLDGLVMARSAFNHSVNYRSAMCFGTARLVSDPDEKLHALRAMVDRFYPGRFETLRPVTAQEIKATGFIAMPIDEASMKSRAHGVGEDAADAGHEVWAGVINLETRIVADAPCPRMEPPLPRPAGLAPLSEGARLDEALLHLQRLYEGEVGALV